MRKNINYLIVFAVIAFSSLFNPVLSQCTANFTDVELCVVIDGFPEEIHWLLISQSGDTVSQTSCGDFANAAAGDTICMSVCLENSISYTFLAFDDWGDGWNGGSFYIKRKSDQCIIDKGFPTNGQSGDQLLACGGSDLEASVTFNPEFIFGCTDPAAINYNPCADLDDGLCIFNDQCVDALEIFCGDTITGTTIGATIDTSLINCPEALNTSAGVWYSIKGNGDSILLSLCGSDYDTKIGVFTSNCSNLQCIDGNDDDDQYSCTGSLQSAVKFFSVSNTTYYIYVTGFASEEGVFSLSATCKSQVCAVPSNLHAQPMGKKATFSWDQVPGATGYQLVGSRVGFTLIPPINLGAVNSFTTSNTLSLNASYYWTVKAICQANEMSAFAPFDTFTTQALCSVPTPVFETNISPSSAVLNWQPVLDALGYRILGRQTGSSTIITIDISNGSQTSFTAGGLTPATSYDWTVQAFCEYTGFSSVAPFSTFTTLVNTKKLLNAGSDLLIFPNPAQDVVFVEYERRDDRDLHLNVLDVSGRVIMQFQELKTDNFKFNVEHLEAGIYFIELQSKERNTLKKLIIK